MDKETPDIKLEKPSALISEGANIVKEFLYDVVSEDKNEDETPVLSKEGKLRIENQYNEFIKNHDPKDFDKTVVKKYYYFCDEMHRVYKKSVRAILACKIITAILFFVLTGILIHLGNVYGDKMLWFSIWVLTIFIDVGIYIVVDYFKDSVKNKALPYLDNIEVLSFKKNTEDEEETEEEENDDEEDI